MIWPMSNEVLPPDRLRTACKATAIEAARRAGEVLQTFQRSGFRIEHKDTVNLVTDADRESERVIVDTLHQTFPDHQFLAEEQGHSSNVLSAFQWIIDPLDGTTNFAHNVPVYCVSIGLEYQGRCILGVVLDPTREELFVAEENEGAFLNDRPIKVSRTPTLNTALLVTGFAYDIRTSTNNNLNHFSQFSLHAQGVRRMGAAALDLCYVASGRFDGFWELNLQPWDMAAGVVILQEAGGRVSDFTGQACSIYGKELVASNRSIHRDMLHILSHG